MTYNTITPVGHSTRIGRPDIATVAPTADGPIAVLRMMSASAREHKLTLIICTALGLAVAALYAHSLPQIYTSAATLLLEPRRQATTSGWETAVSQALDVNRADSELQVIRSERLLTAVFDSLNLQNSEELADLGPNVLARTSMWVTEHLLSGGTTNSVPSDNARTADEKRQSAFANFGQRLTARRIGQSYAIEIEYASKDPALAVRVANSAASAYILQSVAYKADIAKTGTEFLQGRIDVLANQVATATEAMQHGTLPQSPTPDADGRIIGAAQMPLSPTSPRSKLIIAFGGVAGLIVGIALLGRAVIFDRKVRSSKRLAQQTGVPCIGTVPEVPKRKGMLRRGRTKAVTFVPGKATGAFIRAIRDLHTSIDIISPTVLSTGGLVVAIGSWKADTGVSTLCVNLAQLARRSGRPVTIFTTTPFEDDRQPSEAPAWLSASLAAEAGHNLMAYTGADGVTIVPIVQADSNPEYAVDFRDPFLKRLVGKASSIGNVFLDLPPLSQSADGIALAQLSDAVVVVARARLTTHDEVSYALDQLFRARTNVIGTVINRAVGWAEADAH